MDGEVRSDAVDRGVTAGGNDTRPDAASVTKTTKGKYVELTGTGRARLSKDYEWQPITFGCRWDPKKEEVTKAWYTAVDASRLGVPTAERQAAMDACRQAVRGAVWDDAEKRGYRWPRDAVVVGLERYGDLATNGRTTEVTGEGWYKADARHSQSTPITFRCARPLHSRPSPSRSSSPPAATSLRHLRLRRPLPLDPQHPPGHPHQRVEPVD